VTRIVESSVEPSERLAEACAMFGLVVRRAGGDEAWRWRRRPLERLARRIDASLGPGEIALVGGASGAGKSTVLRAMCRIARRDGRAATVVNGRVAREVPMIDLLDGDVETALRTLARAGLADATLLPRTPRELSDGQRARLALALAMHQLPYEPRARARGHSRPPYEPRAQARGHLRAPYEPRAQARGHVGTSHEPVTVFVDELASALDATTGQCVCSMLARWVRASGCRLVGATPRDDLFDVMAPEIALRLGEDGAPSLMGVTDDLADG